MKKILILGMTLLLSSMSFAQGLDFGVKAGVNFASVTDASSLDNRTGFVAGIFAGIKFTDNWAIQGDLLYSQQGAEGSLRDLDLNYVNLPIVIKYFLIKGLHVHAGPQFGFIVDDNVTEVFGNIVETESFDLTGVIGVGYDLPLGLRFDGRYNFGLTNVLDLSGIQQEILIDDPGNNSVITLSVGYSFL